MVVQNVPGAGSVQMANQLVNTGARDGSVIGAPINGMATAPLLQPEAVRFDATKLIWIGAAAREVQVAIVWHTAPVQTLNDLYTHGTARRGYDGWHHHGGFPRRSECLPRA